MHFLLVQLKERFGHKSPLTLVTLKLLENVHPPVMFLQRPLGEKHLLTLFTLEISPLRVIVLFVSSFIVQ